MLERLLALLETIVHRVSRRVWARRAHRLDAVGSARLRRWRRQARELQPTVQHVLVEADRRLSAGPARVEALDRPSDATFFHRPEVFDLPLAVTGLARPAPGTALGSDMAIHHDIAEPEFILRQQRNPDGGGARFGLVLEAYELQGSFLSFALRLPEGEAQGTQREELVRLSYDLEMDAPLEVFARLNLRHGPNVEQIVREVDLNARDRWVEFDVFYTAFDPRRGKDIWVDLIFQTPTMNTIKIRDLTVLRRPRMSL